MPTDSIWSYAPGLDHARGADLTGYTVVARDGTAGHVDRRADHHGMPHLVVDTGVWVFGRSLLVPVGVITSVDTAERKLTVSCTRAELKAAPRFRTDSETMDVVYLTAVGLYYSELPREERPA
ncbi:PRC-barrel domain containing protein [Actinospica acidiphila]|uniref:PRC-barrel domain containing protein n=1 Tax=Actinospica acidiphila TaxID=304899 RepID=A0A9X5HCH1_9ACTN|nr:PRC-barrel domain containing protein [Actinospica acidiphila]NEC49266.1 PRC-barrel domain containing protein [Actinospica acidiphila]